MGKVTEADVDKMARLAHLALTAAERREIARQLDRILDHAERIRELDTDGVAPTSQIGARWVALRDDRTRDCLPREEVRRITPDEEDGLIRVPKIIP